MDRVFNKRVQDRMVNYQLMYMNILWPIGVQIMTVILCFFYVIQQNRANPGTYDYTFFLPRSKFVSKSGVYPQWRLGLFSFWDEINAVLTSLPGPYISLTLQSILTNLNVVWTVVISIFYLGARYQQIHYIGCFLIIMSGLVSVTVELQTGKGLTDYTTADGTVLTTSALWYARCSPQGGLWPLLSLSLSYLTPSPPRRRRAAAGTSSSSSGPSRLASPTATRRRC